MKLLVLGSDGMVGHVVKLFFSERGHNVSCFDHFDDLYVLGRELAEGRYDAVIDCMAVINQDAEADKFRAIKINALLPHFLEAATAGTQTVVVSRSTDCIFSGDKGSYSLTDWPDAASFYARTKALGELNNDKDITIRTSLIGPETDANGIGLFNWFYHQAGKVNGFANAIWTGLTTMEFARVIETLLLEHAHGLFQAVPNVSISKYELLCLFEKYFPGAREVVRVENIRSDKSLIQAMNGSKAEIPGYEDMILQMRAWIEGHKNLYFHYEV